MNEIQIFNNEQFGTIRTINIEGEPWFVGKDVAHNLGYARPTKAIHTHVDNEDKDDVPIRDSIGRMQNTIIINESGLYGLILSSKIPDAKVFKRWVTSEVLPSIRKHGMYATDELLDNPDLLIEVATALKIEREKNKTLTIDNEKMKPKALFADAVSESDNVISIAALAKILNQNGIDIGQNRLFQWLRENGFLIKRKGADYNAPTQYAMKKKLFVIREYVDSLGEIRITPKVTGIGQQYFVNVFLKMANSNYNRKKK